MERNPLNELEPFGEPDCESELKLLGTDEYSKYYFYHIPFNEEAMDRRVFLIIGRRGSGKTALSHFFSFQKLIPNTTAIDVDEPAAFQQVMLQIAANAGQSREVAIPQLVKIWEFVIWSIIFREFQHKDVRIKAALIFINGETENVSTFIRDVLKALMSKFLKSDNSLADELESLLKQKPIKIAKEAILEIAKKNPIIVAIDTLENYAVKDESMMRAIGALIQCASDFTRQYAPHNIQIKLFIMAEIFPHLKEEVVLNTLKFVRNEVYLHWRPKDLMRLISWRFWRYLKAASFVGYHPNNINWDNHRDVLTDRWEPFFGDFLNNEDDLLEKTFPYVLRHTQLRPRQLIVLCNSIANYAKRQGRFPHFTPEDLIMGIKQGEERLADEVFNSYISVYPNAAKIAEALSGLPLFFKGNELDKRAPQSASLWISGEYSPYSFRQLLAELGIVGRVRNISREKGIIEADFEYASDNRLSLQVGDDCVIHPMFYKKLNIKKAKKSCVYPFPDHEEFKFEEVFETRQ